LIDSNFVAKITDLGLTRTMATSMTKRTGTTRWTAPEVLAGARYTDKADVYSFSILAWEIITFEVPFASFMFTYEVEDHVLAGGRPPIPAHTPSGVRAITEACWAADPRERPTFRQVSQLMDALTSQGNLPDDLYTSSTDGRSLRSSSSGSEIVSSSPSPPPPVARAAASSSAAAAAPSSLSSSSPPSSSLAAAATEAMSSRLQSTVEGGSSSAPLLGSMPLSDFRAAYNQLNTDDSDRTSFAALAVNSMGTDLSSSQGYRSSS
jgi:Protein tyrosine and serine/threonine kinase